MTESAQGTARRDTGMLAHVIQSALLLHLGNAILRELLGRVGEAKQQKPPVPNTNLRGADSQTRAARRSMWARQSVRGDSPAPSGEGA